MFRLEIGMVSSPELQFGQRLPHLPLILLALALFSVGTGLGSLWCEKLSQRTVEIGLVPFGALGMTVFCADLYFARGYVNTEAKADVHYGVIPGTKTKPTLLKPGAEKLTPNSDYVRVQDRETSGAGYAPDSASTTREDDIPF